MAALDFPTSPTTGQTYTANGVTYKYNGVSWVVYLTSIITPLLVGTMEYKVAVAASAIDCSAANYFTKTATGALTWTATNVPPSGNAFSFVLDLTNGGTGTQTWFSGTKWPGGTAPTLTTSGRDMLGFFTTDGGTTWSGVVMGLDVK